MATKFPVHQIARRYFSGEMPRFWTHDFMDTVDSDLPLSVPAKPPFKNMWLEYRMAKLTGGQFDEKKTWNTGVWVQYSENDNSLALRVFDLYPQMPLSVYPLVSVCRLDKEGVVRFPDPTLIPETRKQQEDYTKFFGELYPSSHTDKLGALLTKMGDEVNQNLTKYQALIDNSEYKTPAEVYQAAAKNLGLSGQEKIWARWISAVVDRVNTAHFVLRLLNVKNIEVIEVGGGDRKKGGKRSNRHKGERHYTLRIHPGSQRSVRSGAPQPLGVKNSFHIARGHFKTYTEDAPLLGKHVGTYWWEAHARGSKSAGTITKDYEVHPQKGGDGDGA